MSFMMGETGLHAMIDTGIITNKYKQIVYIRSEKHQKNEKVGPKTMDDAKNKMLCSKLESALESNHSQSLCTSCW